MRLANSQHQSRDNKQQDKTHDRLLLFSLSDLDHWVVNYYLIPNRPYMVVHKMTNRFSSTLCVYYIQSNFIGGLRFRTDWFIYNAHNRIKAFEMITNKSSNRETENRNQRIENVETNRGRNCFSLPKHRNTVNGVREGQRVMKATSSFVKRFNWFNEHSSTHDCRLILKINI